MLQQSGIEAQQATAAAPMMLAQSTDNRTIVNQAKEKAMVFHQIGPHNNQDSVVTQNNMFT